MKRGHIVLLSVAAIVAGLIIAALLVPLDVFRGPLEAAASHALGREVRIGGPLHLAVYPRLGISLKDVAVANAAGDREKEMVTVGKIVVVARLAPLLSGHLDVTKIVLKQPVIHLEVGSNGIGNWQAARGAGAVRLEPNPSAPVRLGFGSVRIEDGTVAYFDARSRKSRTLSHVELTLDSTDVAGARRLDLDGTATYNSVPLRLHARLGDLQGFIGGRPATARVKLDCDLFSADFAGSLDPSGSLAGNLTLNAVSLRRLAAWAGQALPPGNGFGAVGIVGKISSRGDAYALSNATILLDGMKLTGDLSLDTGRAIPAIKGTLAVDHIDVRPYLAPGTSADVAAAAAQVHRDTPLALGGLKGLDADLSLTIGRIMLPDFRIDGAVLSATLHNGVLQARLSRIAAYGGTGTGTLTVDASGPIPNFRSVLSMNGINVQAFLGEVAGITQIGGAGAVQLDLASHGQSEADIVKALGGKGAISVGRGTIYGVDLAAVARVLQSTVTAQILADAVGGNARTEFSSMHSTFTIENGLLRTTDLSMVSPAVLLTGTGVVNLVNHQIDFHLVPTARQGIPGLSLVDIGIPFHVGGTWENPTYAPDPSNLATGIVHRLEGGATRLPSEILKAPGAALKSLFGGH